MPRFKMRNGIRMQFTPEEEIARDAEEVQAAIVQEAEKAAEAVILANKASAKTKLEALGLTTDELKDTFGL